jgi:hypothetical protein
MILSIHLTVNVNTVILGSQAGLQVATEATMPQARLHSRGGGTVLLENQSYCSNSNVLPSHTHMPCLPSNSLILNNNRESVMETTAQTKLHIPGLLAKVAHSIYSVDIQDSQECLRQLIDFKLS